LKGQDAIKVLWNAQKGKDGNNVAKYKENIANMTLINRVMIKELRKLVAF